MGYIKFETAKLAKEKGFSSIGNNYMIWIYDNEDKSLMYVKAIDYITKYKNIATLAPTQTELRKWLIDKYKIYIELIIDGWGSDECVSEENIGYRAFIWTIGKPKPHHNDDIGMGKFETILETALQDALKTIEL